MQADQQRWNDQHPAWLHLNNLSQQFINCSRDLHKEQSQQATLQQSITRQTGQIEGLRAEYQQTRQHCHDLEQLLVQERQITSLTAYRQQLQAGEACPLCGATEHPAIEHYRQLNVSDTEKRLKARQQTLEQLQASGEGLGKEAARLQAQLESSEQAMKKLQDQMAGATSEWACNLRHTVSVCADG